ncbi:hypothetical protein [Candidatus Contubernalis alkaliaceticus]|uniref:hypothetical protein n=1 Tax=Candidatus Contubernalis alkaliaceticus TaxID=338645 RepID=UPI001F4BD1EE|nr:hypothetical protein [Candidatus Contubernalis alkalaceticus]UNC91703.1 hypothetical protein HUE98_06110 [Candidatus Contubernalis alkalaceticus]
MNILAYLESKRAQIVAQLADSKATIAKNKSEDAEFKSNQTQQQLDGIILESGTSDAELVQARGSEPLLYNRLDRVDKKVKQNTVDFVNEVRKHNQVNEHIYAKMLGDRSLQVAVPLRGKKAAIYDFVKDHNDDFIKFANIQMGEVGIMEGILSRKNYDSDTEFGNFTHSHLPFAWTGTPGARFEGVFTGTGVEVQLPRDYRGGIWDFYLDANITQDQRDMDSRTGNWILAHAPNSHTSEVGATMTITFTGTEIGFRHYADNRGGVWEFVIDCDTENKVQISTWRSSGTQDQYKQIFLDLAYEEHTLVGTFIGDDPENPPEGGTSRGWANINPDDAENRYTFLFSGGDYSNQVTLSCWREQSTLAISAFPLWSGLDYDTYVVTGVYRGADPEHPPGDGSTHGRGWIAFRDPEGTTYRDAWTFLVLDMGINTTVAFNASVGHSNKEFAILISPKDSGFSNKFIPDHGDGTVFVGTDGYQKIYFDDALIDRTTLDDEYTSVKSVKVIQKMVGIHPDDNGEITCDIYCVHTITTNGVHYKVKIIFRKPTFSSAGYLCMLPWLNSFGEELVTGIGNKYPSIATDGSATYLSEEYDLNSTFAVINKTGTSEKGDTVLAMTLHNLAKTMRQGQGNRGRGGLSTRIVWLEHRDTTMQKLYPHQIYHLDLDVGDELEASCSLYLGELPLARYLL